MGFICKKNLLYRLGFGDVWVAQGVGNINTFIKILKIRVKDIFMQELHSRLENSTRARFYFHISDFRYQPYLDILQIQKYRRNLSRLRVSSPRLEIEMGRWAKPNKIPSDNRICKSCNVLEDEFHFILECTLFQTLGKTYIKKYFWNRPNMPKLIELITTANIIMLKNLSVYIEKAFRLRNEIVCA